MLRRMIGNLVFFTGIFFLFTGCLPEDPTTEHGDGVLQGVVVNGVTGERLRASQVSIWTIVGIDALYAQQAKGDRSGDFAIYGIPQGVTLPVVAAADGFVMMEGYIHIPVGNRYLIGNIVLYPEGTLSGNVEVYVYDDFGTPVSPGTLIVMSPDSTSVNGIVDDEFNDTYILRSVDNIRYGEVTALTDENGLAVFSGDDLALGARYAIRSVNALDQDGMPLHQAGSAVQMTIGTDYMQQVLFLNHTNGLPIARWINTEDGSLENELVVLFSYPIQLCGNPNDMDVFFTAPDFDGDGQVTTPDNVTPIEVTLSADGLVLTAKYIPGTQDFDDPLSVFFSGIRVQAEFSTICQLLSSVELRDTATTLGTTGLLEIQVR